MKITLHIQEEEYPAAHLSLTYRNPEGLNITKTLLTEVKIETVEQAIVLLQGLLPHYSRKL